MIEIENLHCWISDGIEYRNYEETQYFWSVFFKTAPTHSENEISGLFSYNSSIQRGEYLPFKWQANFRKFRFLKIWEVKFQNVTHKIFRNLRNEVFRSISDCVTIVLSKKTLNQRKNRFRFKNYEISPDFHWFGVLLDHRQITSKEVSPAPISLNFLKRVRKSHFQNE